MKLPIRFRADAVLSRLWPSARVTVYEWLTKPDFLVFALFPDASVLRASAHDEADLVLRKIPSRTDAFLFHLNCTVTDRFPADRRRLIDGLLDRRIRPLNAAITNISKRSIQERCRRLGLNSTLAERAGDDDELVIVKTDLNYGGKNELTLTLAERTQIGIPNLPEIITKYSDYKVLPRRQVPEEWWQNETLVCERFISNTGDRWYRAFRFLSRMVLLEMVNPARVKKVGGSTMSRRWFLSFDESSTIEGLDESCPMSMVRDLQRFVQDAQLDFGAIDVLTDDTDRAYIIDVNSTPAYYHAVPGLTDFFRPARHLLKRHRTKTRA